MKAKVERKENMGMEFNQTVNTDALISDFEFMYQMFRLQIKLDIDTNMAGNAVVNKRVSITR